MVNNSYLSGGGLLVSCHKFFDSFLAWYGIRLYKIQKKKKKTTKKTIKEEATSFEYLWIRTEYKLCIS